LALHHSNKEPPTAKAELPSLAEVRDILDNARRFANLIELAASFEGERGDAIGVGTNAIIAELEKADGVIARHVGEAP
jgi:hypothetical protein